MKLKLLVVLAVFAAGLGASYALADNGNGDSQGGDHHCREVHVNGTVGPQTYTVTLTRDSKRLNLKAGATVVVTIGATGQIVRFNGEGCSSTTGTTTTTSFNEGEVHAFTPRTTSTAASTGGITTHKSGDDDH